MSDSTPRIHPTAVIGPDVVLADDVTVGAYVIIDGKVTLGEGCVIEPHVVLHGPLTMGRNNRVGSGSVIGGDPQYRNFKHEETSIVIGDDNVFREFVTINKGTVEGGGLTRVGNSNYLMTGAHIAHDCHVHDNCTLINHCAIAGHVELFDHCLISAFVGVQQRSRVGRLAMMGGHSRTTKDIPPFTLAQGHNTITGLNLVGMRRAGIPRPSIDAVRKVFKILFRKGLTIPKALDEAEQEFGEIAEVRELTSFIRNSKIGISRLRESSDEIREI
jgi:UDP-N-acetylglucosamine acyltransferase